MREIPQHKCRASHSKDKTELFKEAVLVHHFLSLKALAPPHFERTRTAPARARVEKFPIKPWQATRRLMLRTRMMGITGSLVRPYFLLYPLSLSAAAQVAARAALGDDDDDELNSLSFPLARTDQDIHVCL